MIKELLWVNGMSANGNGMSVFDIRMVANASGMSANANGMAANESGMLANDIRMAANASGMSANGNGMMNLV